MLAKATFFQSYPLWVVVMAATIVPVSMARQLDAIKIMEFSDKTGGGNPKLPPLPPSIFGCTKEQIATLKNEVKVAREALLEPAWQLLVKKDAINSEAVVTFLGPSGDFGPKFKQRYETTSKNLASHEFVKIPDTSGISKPNNELLILCPSKPDPKYNPCNDGITAFTIDMAAGEPMNIMMFCPEFWKRGDDLQTFIDSYRKEKPDPAPKPYVDFKDPTSKANVIAHEVQHSALLQLSDDPADALPVNDLPDEKEVYNPSNCATLSNFYKPRNAENWQLIAFLAAADPDRFIGRQDIASQSELRPPMSIAGQQILSS